MALNNIMSFMSKLKILTNVVATIPDIPPSKKFLTLWEVDVAFAAGAGTLGTTV